MVQTTLKGSDSEMLLLSAVLTDTSDILLSDVDVFADEQPVNKDTADKKLTAVINVFS